MRLLTLSARCDQASSQTIKPRHADLLLPTPATIAMLFSLQPCPSRLGVSGVPRRTQVLIAARACVARAGARGPRSTGAGRHSCPFSCIVSSVFMIHDHYSYALTDVGRARRSTALCSDCGTCLLPRAGATGPRSTGAGRTSPSAPMRAATTQDRYRRLSP